MLLGDGDERGSALVSDATWQTGNLAVGFQSSADLASRTPASSRARAASSTATSIRSRANTRVATVRGAGSFWRVDELTIGGRGTVEVEDGAHLETLRGDAAKLERVQVGQPDDPGEATLLVNSGGELRREEPRGRRRGQGPLIVARPSTAIPSSTPTSLLIVGDGRSARGRVQVSGDPSTDGFSLVADEFQIGVAEGARGELTIEFGGKALTSTDAFVGSEGGSGIVRLLGAPLGSPELLTSGRSPRT